MKTINRRKLIGSAAILTAGSILTNERPALAAAPLNLDFMLHATFFSDEMKLSKPLDPEVFVFDAVAPSALGPQGIHHIAGYRPAFVDGPAGVGAYNANGVPLGFQIAQWFAARGTVKITPRGDGAVVTCNFSNLRPNGVYSLFENHFDKNPVGFTPIDGTGKTNNFGANANGAATVTVLAPKMLTHENAVLLVYHSDNQSHGMERGQIGVVAHHQLIARISA